MGVFSQNTIDFDSFQFDRSEDPTYESWKQTFDSIDFSQYDAVYTGSLGWVMTARYLAEKGIKVPRIVMRARWISNAVSEGKKPNIESIYKSLESLNTWNIADEIIVIHAKNDDTVPFSHGKDFAEKLGAVFVGMEIGNHELRWQYQLIAGLIKTGAPLQRIPEVLDVWMDSGSMPYAQMHYPFENKGEMEASFPADFIAEYVGQVRAWFYVMHVLGVLLNPNKKPTPTPSFTNVITTGVINGNDGRKMSKSFGNYPDPRATIEKYGADPIRFYMLNSPLLSGGDMDFKEEQIIETVKGVMLPIWNTYSFFTTYANIDGWKKDETEVWFARHAESTSNVAGMMSDGTDNPELTEKWKEQASNAAKTLKEQGKNFDIIIHTGLTRTMETARIIWDVIGFTGEYTSDDWFIEQHAWEYAGKTLEEIAKIWGIPSAEKENHDAIRRLYKNNQKENIEQFESRILDTFEKVLAKYKGKRVLVVWHSGTSRPIQAKYFGKWSEKAHFGSSIVHAEPFRLITTPLTNPLDRWILSKLQVLMGQVHDAMDGYDITRACRAIVDYMDELTNWYVRLSRRRFWESGMTPDKASAYETLYTVLLELSKLLAPYMPFLAESIYKGLTDVSRHPELAKDPEEQKLGFFVPQNDRTDENSVHLQYITRPSRHLIDNELNRDMEKCERIVSLGLGLRSRKNIRVRQPLQSVTITESLDAYYQSIIKDELNVKEVRFENPENLAKKICKPDARKIGPRFGKDVQAIITAAKNGDFQELPDWKIQVWTFTLELWEYTLEYLPLEGIGDVEGGYGMVVALDTDITEALKLEWYARDLVRAIQEMRKEADYAVTDRIEIRIQTWNNQELSTMPSETWVSWLERNTFISSILSDWKMYIERETLSQIRDSIIGADREKSVTIDEVWEILITLKR